MKMYQGKTLEDPELRPLIYHISNLVISRPENTRGATPSFEPLKMVKQARQMGVGQEEARRIGMIPGEARMIGFGYLHEERLNLVFAVIDSTDLGHPKPVKIIVTEIPGNFRNVTFGER